MYSEISPDLLKAIGELNYAQDSYYIVDLPLLRNNYSSFLNSFSNSKFAIAYSYKTNYLYPLVTTLDSLGAYSELVSPFEVSVSQQYGICPSKIVYNGPLKDYNSIHYVLSGGGLVNADSTHDLSLIESVCRVLPSSIKPRIGIRLSLPEPSITSRFGIECSPKNLLLFLNILAQSLIFHASTFICLSEIYQALLIASIIIFVF